jgi:drug/metabolite transporter (DMT)-like permease
VSQKFKSVLGILFVMLIWGGSFAITKNAMREVPPMLFAFLRFLTASVVLQLMVWTRRSKPADAAPIPFWPLFWMGLTGVGFFYIFFNYSLVYTSASMGALIQAFIPVFITLLAFFFLRERLNFAKIGSLVLSIAGVLVVTITSKADQSASDPVLGNTFMIISVLAWAIYTIISKKLADHDSLKVTAYSTYIGTLLLMPSVLVELWHHPLHSISAQSWLSVAYLGILASSVSYLLYNQALKYLPASVVGVFINLDPIIGAIISVIFLHEHLGTWQIAGSFLVLTGMWLSTTGSEKQVVAEQAA